MEARNLKGELTATSTWVICVKCNKNVMGDDTMSICPGCKEKLRFQTGQFLDFWDWVAISIIPAFGTLFCYLNESLMRILN